MRQIVILAGGRGSRLKPYIGDLPKPMVNIGGKPLLEHQILLANSHGFTDIVLLVGYRAEAIRDSLQDGAKWGVNLRYIEEPIPRGTAGAVLGALDELADRFIVMYGDTMLNVDLSRFYNVHDSRGADVTLLLHPNDHPHDSDLVDIDEQGRIIAFHPYPRNPDRYYPNLVNAALYVIEKSVMIPYMHLRGIVDFGKDLLPRMLRERKYLYGYTSPEYIKDVGTPGRLEKVQADFRHGYIASRSLTMSAPAVFLDRDGTLNVEANHVRNCKDLELMEGVSDAVRRLNHSVYRTVVITNQPVVARGECSESDLKHIHNKLETLLGHKGAYVDAIYYCPHHPHGGFGGERRELKRKCYCRKPEPGLIYRAAKELNIDISESWFIGDTTVDIMTAQNAGLKSILVRTGHMGLDNQYPVKPDFEFYTLRACVEFILGTYPHMHERAKQLVNEVRPGARVIIGGLNHSGKSTWASVLRYAFEERGQTAVIVPLDNWRTHGPDDGMGGITACYDFLGIENFISHLNAHAHSVTHVLPDYDRKNRIQQSVGTSLKTQKDDVIIFEGVVGLLISELINASTKKIFVECSERRRKAAFTREYELRGFSQEDISRIYQRSEVELTPEVLLSRGQADIVLEGLANDY